MPKKARTSSIEVVVNVRVDKLSPSQKLAWDRLWQKIITGGKNENV